MPRARLAIGATLIALLASATPALAQGEDEAIQAAAEQVRHGRDRDARRTLHGLRSPKARYLRGRLEERAGDLRAALGSYAAPMPGWSDGDVRRGRMLARLGECETARETLQPAGDGLSQALVAECAVRAGMRGADLEARLRALIERDPAGVDTFALRQHLAAIVEHGAESIRREAQLAHPTHPDARPFEVADLTLAERFALAERFMRAARPADALVALDVAPPSGRAARRRLLHARGMALYGTRTRYAEAAEVLAEAARLGGPNAGDARFHAARALSRADQDRAAIRAYDRFARRDRNHPRTAQATYLAAWLALRVTPADGRRRMGAIARGGGGRAQRARFQLGLHELRRGRARPAATHFEGFARHAEGDDRLRGRYWAGRAKGGAAGRRLLRQVAEADPFGWYGALACARLRACPDPEDAPETAAALTIELPEDALQYASLGLSADAARRLRRADGALRRQAPRGRVNEVRARAYAQVGDIGRAFRLASRAREELRRTPDTWAWPLAYPRPFLPAAERAAAAQQVPLALLYGIMRQESGYDPRAYSGAGAAGLLQLMENVAARHARRLGIRAERFDAEANIALGAAEMAGLLRRFDGRLPLVAAAYNAGAARVRRWQRELPNDLDLFVELIPFDETRRYVKRVMGHVIRYTVLAGEPRPQLARTVNVGEASSER